MPLDRFLTLHVVQPWRRHRGAAAPRLPILMYHRIAAGREPGVPARRRLCTSPARFHDHLQWLADAGWRGATAAAALAEPTAPRICAITFDDGFLDFLTNAVPVLERFSFRASVYLPTAFIGHARASFHSHPCLTWSEVRDLHARGFEFGSHTVTHPRLHELPWPQIRQELRDSKAAIETNLQAPVTGFAYPYAFPRADSRFTRALIPTLRDLGYRYGLTTTIGCDHRDDHPFLLHRLPVSDADDRALFLAKLEGHYDWLAAPQAWSKRARRALAGRA